MGPDGCRETRGTGTREAACKPRQDFSIQKGPIFSSLWLSMMSNQRKKVGPFVPFKMGHVALLFEKKTLLYKKAKSSLSFFKNFNSFFPPSMLLFLFFSTIVASIEAPNSSSFLPQIARKSHFRSLGAYLYFVGL